MAERTKLTSEPVESQGVVIRCEERSRAFRECSAVYVEQLLYFAVCPRYLSELVNLPQKRAGESGSTTFS